MLIQLNGEPHALPGPVTIQELLDSLGIDARTVAVEVNRVVVGRATYSQTTIGVDDEVEIVAFVGGGAPGCAKL
ncbi:MAG TPA: sulfur carrier protein ThiS [Vicinamibacterales bacterium]|nr:sulfur carrier protein ThiS [Vicinamibacterales bacterium]